jgi:hypothetical protein
MDGLKPVPFKTVQPVPFKTVQSADACLYVWPLASENSEPFNRSMSGFGCSLATENFAG